MLVLSRSRNPAEYSALCRVNCVWTTEDFSQESKRVVRSELWQLREFGSTVSLTLCGVAPCSTFRLQNLAAPLRPLRMRSERETALAQKGNPFIYSPLQSHAARQREQGAKLGQFREQGAKLGQLSRVHHAPCETALCNSTKSSAQGNCSVKSLAALVMSSIHPFSSILPCPCLPPVKLSGGRGLAVGGLAIGGALGQGGEGLGEGAGDISIHLPYTAQPHGASP